MPYTPTVWQSGDIVTSEKLNKLEQGVADATSEQIIDSWLEENISQETGYALDRTLTLQNAAAPADMVGDLKSAVDNIRFKEPIMPSWFPTLPFPVKKTNGVWSFDDIDITDTTKFPVQYAWRTYYVDSANGDDTNNGTSSATPLKTLKAAITKYAGGGYPAKIIVAKDSVFYFDDLYGDITMRKSITIEADDNATIISGYPSSTFEFEQSGNTYVSTASISSLNIVGALDIGADLDDYSLHKPMIPVTTPAEVDETVGSYCIDSGKLYVNPYTSISNIVGITSKYGLTFVSSNPWDAKSGVFLKNIRYIGNVSFSRAAHANKVYNIFDNCIFEHNPYNNAITISGVDVVYAKNCTTGFAKRDGFNVDSGNMTAEQKTASVSVFANCRAKECGYYDVVNPSYNSNLSTGHVQSNILRCGFIGYNSFGPLIADVNGCYSVNYDVTAINNGYDYVGSSKGVFEFNSVSSDRTTKQKCVNCFAYDKRSGFNTLRIDDGEIWISDGNLMNSVVGTGVLYPTEG